MRGDIPEHHLQNAGEKKNREGEGNRKVKAWLPPSPPRLIGGPKYSPFLRH